MRPFETQKTLRKRPIKESIAEEILLQYVKTNKGLCFKLKFLGLMGAPDRLVLMPGSRFFFVELKSDVGELEPSQKVLFPRIEKRGFKVHLVYGVSGVNHFIETELKRNFL